MRNERKLNWLACVSAVAGMSILGGCYTVKTPHVYADPNMDQTTHYTPPAPPAPAIAQGGPIDKVALRELLAQTEYRDSVRRCDALEALTEASPDDAADPAVGALSDDDPTVRFAGCMTVGVLRLSEAHDQLLKMHDQDKSRVVQVGVRFALHRLGDRRYSHDLEEFAVDPLTEVRGKTAFVLGRLGEPSAIALLRPMRHDADETVRIEAAESLWRLHDQKGLDDLVAYAISKYADDVILATLALAAPGDRQVIQHVRANLNDDYLEEDLAAARGLGMLGSDEGYPLAIKCVHSADAGQRSMAALALGVIGHPEARPALTELLSDPFPQVRLAAATAILELRKRPD